MKSKLLHEHFAELYFIGMVLAGCLLVQTRQPSFSQSPMHDPATKPTVSTDPSALPPGPLNDSIRLGLKIFQHTPETASAYVGNKLSCNDCHLQNGTAPYSSPMVGIPGMFPAYNKRANRVITLEERTQECFVRSENSNRMIPADSPEMTALIAYMQWISRGVPSGKNPPGRGLVKLPELSGNTSRGEALYAKQCASCHGAEGAGIVGLFPPVWGEDSFNTGAGMDQPAKMAAFVKQNMPQNHPGSLTVQEAYDLSAYIDSKPHPAFNPAFKNY